MNEETRKEQLPWGHTNLIGSVYLNPAAAPAASGGAQRPATQVAAAPASTRSRDRVLALRKRLQQAGGAQRLPHQLPGGQFRSLALARIAALQKGASTQTRALTTGIDPAVFTEVGSQLSEDQIGLDRNQRRDIQRRLTALGFDNKASGAFDANTRHVFKRWQAARGYRTAVI